MISVRRNFSTFSKRTGLSKRFSASAAAKKMSAKALSFSADSK